MVDRPVLKASSNITNIQKSNPERMICFGSNRLIKVPSHDKQDLNPHERYIAHDPLYRMQCINTHFSVYVQRDTVAVTGYNVKVVFHWNEQVHDNSHALR